MSKTSPGIYVRFALDENRRWSRKSGRRFINLEVVEIATDKAPTKEEILEALSKNSINNIEELVDALMPGTGGYAWHDRDDDPPGLVVAKLKTGSINVHWHSNPDVIDPFVK